MSKLKKNVINGLSGVISDFATRLLIDTGKTWRFYFDENEQEKIKNGLKNFLSGVIENAVNK